MPSPAETAAVRELRDPATIRARCAELLALAGDGALSHFELRRDRLDSAADYVVDVIRDSYPDLDIPFHSRWRHFGVGGIDRSASLAGRPGEDDPASVARTRIDLAVTSVLLDAGAGERWRYVEPGTGQTLARSEGLAIASFHMFADGAFSSDPARPLRADAAALAAVTGADLARGFQIREDNPLAGAEGRAALLRALGEALPLRPALFGDPPRIGNLFDALAARALEGRLPAAEIFAAVLEGLGPIWPGRVRIGGVNLGDVWRHDAIRRDDPSAGLVPFHKLSQWLTYSLVEPFEAAGVAVTGLDALTGLAEYRNGGLMVDLGVLVPRDPAATGPHPVDSELVVEWRALTVALLDELAERVRRRLDRDADTLPLARILEGGTWAAGRRAARERRPGGGPPITVASDGTVF